VRAVHACEEQNMRRAPHTTHPVRPSDRGTVTVKVLRSIPDEDSPTGYTEDYVTLHIDGWDYTPVTYGTREYPGDPSEVTVTSAWLDGDTRTLSQSALDEIVGDYYDEIAHAIDDYEADFGT
jgi:hypothetical protein